MATVPYQPTYSLQPQHGTRYGPSQFVPPVATATASPQTLGAQTPATTGVGAGSATPQAPNYNQDPFAQSATVNGQVQTGVGFRPATPGTTFPYPGTGTPPPGAVPPTTAPPTTVPGAAVNQTIQTLAGDNDRQGGYDRIPAAQALGYTQGTQNPLGIALGLMPGGSFLMDALDINKDYTYGNYGTYDTEGNVFGREGRAYDPITGRAAQSYASKDDWFNTVGNSYSKLRAAGEDIPNSMFGSYENSLYAQQAINPSLNTAQARAAQLRGTADARGVPTMQGLIEANTAMYDPAYASSQGFAEDDLDRIGGAAITAEMLGFDGSRPAPSNISGRFGTQPGDIARTEMGLGVINESGQIETPQGTVVQMTDPYTGQSISLLGSTNNSASGKSTISAQSELARNQALDARSNPEGSGMSGFDVDDGKGGSYQTDSSGTSGAFTGGVTGMEDEYDEPTTDDSSSGPSSACFLTTAIVERRGEADNGETLTKLRTFRDTFMGGKESDDLKEYYDIAPLIIKAIPQDHSDWNWIESQIDLSVKEIDNHEYHTAYNIYKSMVLKLKQDWLEANNETQKV